MLATESPCVGQLQFTNFAALILVAMQNILVAPLAYDRPTPPLNRGRKVTDSSYITFHYISYASLCVNKL